MDELTALACEAEAIARKRMSAMPLSTGVGQRHHTVPRFLLQQFSRAGRVRVRDLIQDRSYPAMITDLAITDFYTAVADVPGAEGEVARELDGRLEAILAGVESDAASAIQELRTNPLQADADAVGTLAMLASFQYVRGVRSRVETEMMADLAIKTQYSQSGSAKARHRADLAQARKAGRTPSRGNRASSRGRRRTLTDAQARDLIFVPHQNEYLRELGRRGEAAFACLADRPLTLVSLEDPTLLIGDEPLVIVEDDGYVQHGPHCLLSARDKRRLVDRSMSKGRDWSEIIHIYPTRPRNLVNADEIALPIAPDSFLLWGPRRQSQPRFLELEGEESAEVAAELNRRVVADAYAWIAGHPDESPIDTIDVPERSPVISVCTSQVAAAAAMTRFPGRPMRLRHPRQ